MESTSIADRWPITIFNPSKIGALTGSGLPQFALFFLGKQSSLTMYSCLANRHHHLGSSTVACLYHVFFIDTILSDLELWIYLKSIGIREDTLNYSWYSTLHPIDLSLKRQQRMNDIVNTFQHKRSYSLFFSTKMAKQTSFLYFF